MSRSFSTSLGSGRGRRDRRDQLPVRDPPQRGADIQPGELLQLLHDPDEPVRDRDARARRDRPAARADCPVRRGPRGGDAVHRDHRRRVRAPAGRTPGEPRHAHRLGRLHRPQADAGRPRRRLAARPAAAPAVVQDGAGLVALSARVPGVHADPRRSGRLVSIPVPRRLPARLRRGLAQLRGDAGRVRRSRLGVRGGRELAGCPSPDLRRQSWSPISIESQSSPLWRRNCRTRRPSSTKPSLR